MIKELVEMQRNVSATCVVVQPKDVDELLPSVKMAGNTKETVLANGIAKLSGALEKQSKKAPICYFIVMDIDKVEEKEQTRYVVLVKDRYLNGYTLPKNCIIVFTVKDKQALNKITPALYHYATVAF